MKKHDKPIPHKTTGKGKTYNPTEKGAGMTAKGQQAGAGMNPLAMAMMLRKGQDQQKIDMANAEMSAFNQRPAQNYYSAGMNPMNIQSDMDY